MIQVRKCGRALRILAVFLLLLTLATSSCQLHTAPPGRGLSPASDLEALVQAYNLDRQLELVTKLVAERFQGRAAGTEGEDLARKLLAEELQSLGLQPWSAIGLAGLLQPFAIAEADVSAENLVVVRPGTSDSYLVLTAHYDHLGVRDGVTYPGADDNAVGVAAAVEIMRCFAETGVATKRSIVLALLSGEETGLHGSRALAAAIRKAGVAEQCIVLNLDMLGGVGGNSLDVWAEGSRWSISAKLARLALQEIQSSGLRARRLRRRFGPVDSRSFQRAGIPSITLSWALEGRYHPYRHTPEDTLENLSPSVLQSATRAALRVAYAMAGY